MLYPLVVVRHLHDLALAGLGEFGEQYWVPPARASGLEISRPEGCRILHRFG